LGNGKLGVHGKTGVKHTIGEKEEEVIISTTNADMIVSEHRAINCTVEG